MGPHPPPPWQGLTFGTFTKVIKILLEIKVVFLNVVHLQERVEDSYMYIYLFSLIYYLVYIIAQMSCL